jgi:abortive phage resistance protein AbiGi (putative antitoxin)
LVSIELLLHRRTDLSTFLVHFTRDQDGGSPARDNLLNILSARLLEARNVLGMATDLARRLPEVAETQRVVSFSETPLEHAWALCEQIDNRRIRLRPYGLAFTKSWARAKACNPVWYLDITPGHEWLTNPINDLVKLAENEPARGWNGQTGTGEVVDVEDAPVLRITPFIEQMGPMTSGGRKEFWWEREWRHCGDLSFALDDIVAVFVPEVDHLPFRADCRSSFGSRRAGLADELHLLDPAWGLERMIAALAGIPGTQAGPLPDY